MTIDLVDVFVENGRTHLLGGVNDENNRWGLTYVLNSESNRTFLLNLLASKKIVTIPDAYITYVRSTNG